MYDDRSQSQGLSSDGEVSTKSIDSTSIDFLLHLYRDAEKADKLLHKLASEVVDLAKEKFGGQYADDDDQNLVVPIHSGLKKMTRAVEKVAEKYGGDFARVTDIVRMTYECRNLKVACFVIETIASHPDVDVTRVKNRLMEEFDASEIGGYRDVLVNVRFKSMKYHIIEIQVSLETFMSIKTQGGHAAYKLARTLGLNGETSTQHRGTLTLRVIEEIKYGVIRKVSSIGPNMGLVEHFSNLVAALSTRSCLLSSLVLGQQAFPVGKVVSDLLTPAALEQAAPHLVELTISGRSVKGVIPDGLWSCHRLKHLSLQQTGISGTISSRIAELSNLESLYLWGMPNLKGCIPEAVGELKKLQKLILVQSSLSGEIPIKALATLPELEICWIYKQNGDGFSNENEADECFAKLAKQKHIDFGVDFEMYC